MIIVDFLFYFATADSFEVDENLAFLNPDREQTGQYQLIYRLDHKLCPKRVLRCQLCRVVFNDTDKFIIKTFGEREGRIDKSTGYPNVYQENIYLHYLTKCLKKHDSNFDYNKVLVPEGTKAFIQDTWKQELRKKGIKI